MAPYCKPGLDGLPLFPLPGTAEVPLPFLGYAPGAYLSRVTDLALKQAPEPAYLDRVYETDMAEGLKAMAIEGHGIAFLPHSAAKKELKAKKLIRADHPVSPQWEVEMDVRAYREKPVSKETVKSGAAALWDYLVARRPETAAARNS